MVRMLLLNQIPEISPVESNPSSSSFDVNQIECVTCSCMEIHEHIPFDQSGIEDEPSPAWHFGQYLYQYGHKGHIVFIQNGSCHLKLS